MTHLIKICIIHFHTISFKTQIVNIEIIQKQSLLSKCLLNVNQSRKIFLALVSMTTLLYCSKSACSTDFDPSAKKLNYIYFLYKWISHSLNSMQKKPCCVFSSTLLIIVQTHSNYGYSV